MNTSEPLNDNIRQFNWWLSSLGILVYLLTLLSLCCDLIRDDDYENPCSLALSLLSAFIKDITQIVFVIAVACLTTRSLSGVEILKSVHGVFLPLITIVKINHDLEQRFVYDDYECLKRFERFLCFILFYCSFILFIVLVFLQRVLFCQS